MYFYSISNFLPACIDCTFWSQPSYRWEEMRIFRINDDFQWNIGTYKI